MRPEGKPIKQWFLTSVSVGALVVAAAACGASGGANSGKGVLGAATTTAAPTTIAPTTIAPTTIAPTTIAPTTTVAPTTTAAPTTTVAHTTVAPTTTEAPTTTAASQGAQGQGSQGQGAQGTSASSALPTVDSDPANADYSPAVKPSTIYLSGDSSNIVSGLNWVGWDGKGATGYGTVTIEGCVPDCAQGTQTPTPVTIYLNNPVNGKFTLLTENIQGMTSQNIPVPTS